MRMVAGKKVHNTGIWRLHNLLFCLLIFCYSYVHQDIEEAIPVSRLDFLHALVEQRRFAIDDTRHTRDVAFFKGHYYSDKAPGLALVALPAFCASTAVLSLYGIPLGSGDGWLYSSWLATMGSIGVITAFGGACYLAWLRKWVPEFPALVSTLALFLGVTVLPYATSMFSHAIVTGLLAIALCVSVAAEKSGCDQAQGKQGFLAGCCCGLALASEYTAAPCVAGLTLYVFLRKPYPRTRFFAGAVAPMLSVPLYGWACFGNPFAIGYDYTIYEEMHSGLYGLRLPSAFVLSAYLFSPSRGLFFWCPFLLLAGAGFPALFRKDRGVFALVVVVCATQTLCMAGKVWDWKAGHTLGPRYLAPMAPFLALVAAFGMARFPKLGTVLAVLSTAITGFASVVCGTPSCSSDNPLFEICIPKALNGDYTHNIGQAIGLKGHWSVLPLCAAVASLLLLLRREIRAHSREKVGLCGVQGAGN